MAYIVYNHNPQGNETIDCVIRGVSVLMHQTWLRTYFGICLQGAMMCDMPSSDPVWYEYLRKNGFKRESLPNTCPDCYTVKDFCRDYPKGKYLLYVLGDRIGHVVAVVDGDYVDTWDSGDRIALFFWRKE